MESGGYYGKIINELALVGREKTITGHSLSFQPSEDATWKKEEFRRGPAFKPEPILVSIELDLIIKNCLPKKKKKKKNCLLMASGLTQH